MDDMKQDIREIKETLVELVKQGAVHNHLLKEHERRSLALESLREKDKSELHARLHPVETHVQGMTKVLKTGGTIFLGVLVGVASKYIISLIA